MSSGSQKGREKGTPATEQESVAGRSELQPGDVIGEEEGKEEGGEDVEATGPRVILALLAVVGIPVVGILFTVIGTAISRAGVHVAERQAAAMERMADALESRCAPDDPLPIDDEAPAGTEL